MDRGANVKIKFNRDLIFDQALVSEFMPDYVEPKIVVEPSEREIQEALDTFSDEYEASMTDFRRQRLL